MSEPERWYKPKLIEVSIPLEDINRESAREKALRDGHPSTLHLWWSRKPLATARAVLFAQLVDDPSGHPDRFPTEETQNAERDRLHGIIKKLVLLENIQDDGVIKDAHYEINKSCGGSTPPILDPFAGGGSIPLEAQRLGLEAHASDLNPVAVLINKALIEIPARFSDRLPIFPGASETRMSWPGITAMAEDIRLYGKWMRDEAERRIGYLYPKAKLADGTTATVISWIWARTVTCPNPACMGIMPLVNSFWLAKKRGKERYVEPIPDGKRVKFEIRGPYGVPRQGTVDRNGAICLICGTPVPFSYIRAEAQAGRMSAQLMALCGEGKQQRYYVPPNEEHEKAADVSRPADIPDAELPDQALGFRVQGYGMRRWADLFTNRQLVALDTFSGLIREAHQRVMSDGGSSSYANAVATYLAFTIDKLADLGNSLVTWKLDRECPVHLFARQAIPMSWGYPEANPFSNSSGSWFSQQVNLNRGLISGFVDFPRPKIGDARQHSILQSRSPDSAWLVSTDPPYYDNVGYADLSDFFYVWLRRSLSPIYPELTATVLTPKSDELVADPFRRGGKDEARSFFEDGLADVFSQICQSTPEGFPITIYYAFKQAESIGSDSLASTGWETMLDGMMKAGWTITGTWPMRTELGNRMRGIGSNALASSIVLACRPRPHGAEVIDRRGLIAALRGELPEALRKLQLGGIAPVDLPQAAIGPGMAVFSRYARVNEPDGSTMRVRSALALINQVLDEVLSQQEGDFGPDTRWCLEWFKTYGFDQGPFGVAETLSKAKNTAVDGLERAGVLVSRAGKVFLRSIADLPADYDPARDERMSEWEIVLHLAKRLNEQGGDAAAGLMAAARSVVDMDAVRELAYLLFSIAERRGWAETALLFNGLATSWSDLTQASRKPAAASREVQPELDYGFDEDSTDGDE